MDTWHLNVEARFADASGLRSAILKADVPRIKKFEATKYRGWDRVVPSNEDDLETMRQLDPSLRFELIPIGFDAGAYAPDPGATRDPNLIVFHGAMNYAPNVEACDFLARQVLPLVRAEIPEAHLALVGRDPSPRVQALGALPGVNVTGGVEDMRAWLTNASVWVGPFLNGTGIKTKLLEAMATDLPAVVTPIGGRGLALDAGVLLVGSTPEELAAHIVGLLRDPARAAALGKAGGDYVRAGYDWPVVGAASSGCTRRSSTRSGGMRPLTDPAPAPAGATRTGGPRVRVAVQPDLAPGENARGEVSGAAWSYLLPDRELGTILSLGRRPRRPGPPSSRSAGS